MQYKELKKLYHQDSSNARDANLQKEYSARFSSESAYHLGYETGCGELFFTVPKELSLLTEQVYAAESEISTVLEVIPSIARGAVLRDMVLDEVVHTNEIEDIHSTRRQVRDAIEAANDSSPADRRFKELATLYLGISENTAKLPEKVEDIRTIYDEVTAREVSASDMPDGKLFRKESVEIIGSGGRLIHTGLESEEKIIDAMEKMLALATDVSIPALYRAVASHYVFEYAHPFYDGNGRTGRYLLSLFLSKSLSIPTALSLSRTIAGSKATYYKAFKSAEDPLNHAELTFFIYSLLKMIREAQIEIIDNLESCKSKLDSLDAEIKQIETKHDLKEKELQIVYILLQREAFGLFGDVSLAEMASLLGLKEQMTRKHLASLEKKGIVEKFKKRNPLSFALTEGFKESLGY